MNTEKPVRAGRLCKEFTHVRRLVPLIDRSGDEIAFLEVFRLRVLEARVQLPCVCEYMCVGGCHIHTCMYVCVYVEARVQLPCLYEYMCVRVS